MCNVTKYLCLLELFLSTKYLFFNDIMYGLIFVVVSETDVIGLIASSLHGVHEKKSPKLIMTYMGSCDGRNEELCWIFWSSVAVL